MNVNEQMEEKAAGMKKGAQEIRDRAQQAGTAAKAKARDAAAGADLYLHEYAWTSVVTVALISGIVGYLLGRQRS